MLSLISLHNGLLFHGLQEMASDYEVVVSSADDKLDNHSGLKLEEWARNKPLSILRLDPSDRAVLRIAGIYMY